MLRSTLINLLLIFFHYNIFFTAVLHYSCVVISVGVSMRIVGLMLESQAPYNILGQTVAHMLL